METGARMSDAPRTRWVRTWPRAVLVTLVLAGALALLLTLIPSRLAYSVERRGTVLRDAMLALWYAAVVPSISWAIVWLQRRGVI